MSQSLFEIRTAAGPTIDCDGGAAVTPYSQSLQFRLPKPLIGGFTWNRPLSVHVREPDGTERSILVVDLTRLALVAIAIEVALMALKLFARHPRRPRPHRP